jgi:hypothetical protein
MQSQREYRTPLGPSWSGVTGRSGSDTGTPAGERFGPGSAPEFRILDIRVRGLDLKLLAHRDSNQELEQKTDRTEHERQQQLSRGALRADRYPQPLRDLVVGQARGYESRVLRLKNGIQPVYCVGVSSETSISH